jgi:polysaccharide export outer membrane protein
MKSTASLFRALLAVSMLAGCSSYRPIFVMGEVGAAGQYSYVPGLTVQKAIAIAGGFTPRANQESVDITRDINGKVMTGRVITSDPLLPGDTVYVRERLF